MIEIKDLTFTYPGADKANLNNINLSIERGDFLAIIGNNGCGKSTLCKTLNGLIPHFIAGDMLGSVVIDGVDTKTVDVGHIAQKVGYVYQDFENQIVRPTVLDDASFACLNYAFEDYKERGKRALNLCGLEHKVNDYIWQLSGGQKHLLALAGVTALSPEVLILDEPIAQLDPAHARQIYDVLKDLNEKHGKTIIVIEHHTEFIADYCKNVVLMKEGRVVWKQRAKEALQRVEELQESNIFPPQITVAADLLKKKGIAEDKELPTTIDEGVEFFGNLKFYPYDEIVVTKEEVTNECIINLHDYVGINGLYNHAGIDETYNNIGINELIDKNTSISFQNVSVEYQAVKGAAVSVMKDLSLKIHRGEKIALIGSNGAGKSTLMKLIIGLLKPSSGKITVEGRETRAIPAEELSRIVSLVYQNPEEMFIKDSIRADIEYAMKVRDVADYEQKTKELLERFHLTNIKDRDGRLLSGGQMRRASLAIGIALNPSILLLDEPTANLDIATRKEIIKTLNDMRDITETVMIATHDMQLVCDWADRIIVLCQGNVIDDGTRNQVFKNPVVSQRVGIRPPEIYCMGQKLHKEAQCYTVEEFCNHFIGGDNDK
ncbi:ABC transporter ATP-binding protein [Clostridium sp. Marseille-P299]|uniref:ABC transporter ATP-binding protein n=1 Tax=Clostridium sp. Marseille-P299 TaxID=1805477 RepID=UPI000830EC05|nr:energy-coupling factor transporter ATPase [Clostridium sp. Marseille-P299]